MFILVLTLIFFLTPESLKVKRRTYMRMLIKLSPIASKMKDRRLQIKPSKLPKEQPIKQDPSLLFYLLKAVKSKGFVLDC